VNNDFHNTNDLFDLFKDLNVKDIDVEIAGEPSEPKVHLNGATNGTTNGTASEQLAKN
jgi:methylenetetrahydrofolate reductase (NADPH)